MEKTLVVLKPDVLARNLAGKTISYFEDAGLRIIAAEYREVTPEFVSQHYPDSMAEGLGLKAAGSLGEIGDPTEYGLKVLTWNRDYMTEGPVLALVLEGDDAIAKTRKVTGFTFPEQADKGTVRGDLGVDTVAAANAENRSVRNMIHASGNPEEATTEIKLWFPSL